MNNNKIALALIALTVASRLLPHEPNFSAIGAATLFAGLYLSKVHALIIPVVSMIIADLFLGFHPTMGWVYLSYGIIAVVSVYNHATKSNARLITLPFISSGIFFFVSNFGVWATGTMYAKTFSGLIECFVMALPFLRGTLAGDLVYSALLIGGYHLLQNRRKQISVHAV